MFMHQEDTLVFAILLIFIDDCSELGANSCSHLNYLF